jgi:hypothetical protein
MFMGLIFSAPSVAVRKVIGEDVWGKYTVEHESKNDQTLLRGDKILFRQLRGWSILRLIIL